MEPAIEDTAIELKPSPPNEDGATVEPSTVPHYGGTDDVQSMSSSTSLTIKGRQLFESSNLLLQKESGPHHTHAEMEDSHETVFFSDGVRRIDYIFAFVDHDDEKKQKQRYSFEANLRETFHLELERVDKEMSLDGRTSFVKVNIPFDVACLYAEKLQIKVELREVPCEEKPSGNFVQKFMRLGMGGSVQESNEPQNLAVPFRNDLREAFVLDNPDTFLSGAMRSRIVYHILSRCKYLDDESKPRFGIDRLVNNGTYTAAFTMHDSKYWQESADSPENCARARLYQQWGRPFACQILQPHSLIRAYYGDKVAMYFAWLGFYTRMLFIAAIVGTICFFYGVANARDTIWSKELCDENIGGKIIMCPQCDQQCTYWRLNTTCTATQQSYLFDNQATMFFSIFMGIWATIFLELWKRYQVSLAPHHGLSLAEQAGERPRPEYEALCTKHHYNPITQDDEPVIDRGHILNCAPICFSIGTVLFWISLVLVCIMAVIVYRLSIFFVMASNFPKQLRKNEIVRDLITPAMVTALTASCINFVVIMILNQLYVRVAVCITNLEVPKTQTAYENSLTMKMFLFQFVNYYSSIFYIAFFKGKFVGFPKDYVYLFGRWRNEECDTSGCLMELTTQLTIIMVGKQIWGNVQEVILPWVMNKLRLRASKSALENPNKHKSRWESDYRLQDLGRLGLFYEYLEMVVQFGFTTLFVVSFPLAPLLALLNNLIEMRLDAWKFVTQYRRPTAARAQTIGVWQQILYGLAMLSVVTNAFIMAFTSDSIPRFVYYFSKHDTDNDTVTHTMVGYINSSLSVFRIEDLQPWSIPNTVPYWFNNATDLNCRYRDYRYPPGEAHQYELTTVFWHVLAARLAYIIIVEHLVFAATFCVAYMIPDIPQKVLDRIKRERHAMARIVREWEVQHLRHSLKVDGEMLSDEIEVDTS